MDYNNLLKIIKTRKSWFATDDSESDTKTYKYIVNGKLIISPNYEKNTIENRIVNSMVQLK